MRLGAFISLSMEPIWLHASSQQQLSLWCLHLQCLSLQSLWWRAFLGGGWSHHGLLHAAATAITLAHGLCLGWSMVCTDIILQTQFTFFQLTLLLPQWFWLWLWLWYLEYHVVISSLCLPETQYIYIRFRLLGKVSMKQVGCLSHNVTAC